MNQTEELGGIQKEERNQVKGEEEMKVRDVFWCWLTSLGIQSLKNMKDNTLLISLKKGIVKKYIEKVNIGT